MAACTWARHEMFQQWYVIAGVYNSRVNIHWEYLPALRLHSWIYLHILDDFYYDLQRFVIFFPCYFFPLSHIFTGYSQAPGLFSILSYTFREKGAIWIGLFFFSTGLFSESHQSLASGRRWLISGSPAKAWQLKPKAMCLLSNWNWAVRVWIQRGCQSARAGDGVSDSVVACPMSLWNYKSTACYPKCITSLGHNCLLTNSWHLLRYAWEYKAAESNNQTVSIPGVFFNTRRHDVTAGYANRRDTSASYSLFLVSLPLLHLHDLILPSSLYTLLIDKKTRASVLLFLFTFF